METNGYQIIEPLDRDNREEVTNVIGVHRVPGRLRNFVDEYSHSHWERFVFSLNLVASAIVVQSSRNHKAPVSRYEAIAGSILGRTAVASSMLAPDAIRPDNHRAHFSCTVHRNPYKQVRGGARIEPASSIPHDAMPLVPIKQLLTVMS